MSTYKCSALIAWLVFSFDLFETFVTCRTQKVLQLYKSRDLLTSYILTFTLKRKIYFTFQVRFLNQSANHAAEKYSGNIHKAPGNICRLEQTQCNGCCTVILECHTIGMPSSCRTNANARGRLTVVSGMFL